MLDVILTVGRRVLVRQESEVRLGSTYGNVLVHCQVRLPHYCGLFV